MSEDLNRRSYRGADAGETYETAPRVNSSHLRITYSRLIHLADNLNFNTSVFTDMLKRNRSLGSAQAFILELALADKRFVEDNLLPFCIGDGVNVLLHTDYLDSIYFERLEAYKSSLKKRRAETIIQSAPAPKSKNKRSYFLGADS